MTSDLYQGQRIRVRGSVYAGQVGTLIERQTRLGRTGWAVSLDAADGRHRTVYVWESKLQPTLTHLEATGLQPGQRVMITARLLDGRAGVLVRPAHLLWRKAWIVDVDTDAGNTLRTRVLERALVPIATN